MPEALDAVSTLPIARYIESIRSIAPLRDRARRVDRLPDGRTCLVFRELEPGRRGDVAVLGPLTRAHFKDARGFARAVVLQFKPGWSTPLLGVSASALTDHHVMLEDLWGEAGRELAGDLLRTKTVLELVERLSRALGTRADRPTEPTSAPLARRAARLLEEEGGRVESVADRLGVTSRHLRRAFAENIGVTPKEFARSARLQRALLLSSTSSNWLRIALAAGYYDQAHLIADFRDLVGLTPSAFAKRASELNPPADLQPIFGAAAIAAPASRGPRPSRQPSPTA